MDWIEITISTNTAGADIVSEALLRQGAVGTQIIDRSDVPDPDKPSGYWELIDPKMIEAMPEDVQVKAWFETVEALRGLGPLLRRRTGELSGGMQRRVSIAMALSTGGDVLVMDEATAGLDEAYREGLLAWMEGFLSRGGCAVWCTHHAGELERLCTRCLTIREGRAAWGAENDA